MSVSVVKYKKPEKVDEGSPGILGGAGSLIGGAAGALTAGLVSGGMGAGAGFATGSAAGGTLDAVSARKPEISGGGSSTPQLQTTGDSGDSVSRRLAKMDDERLKKSMGW